MYIHSMTATLKDKTNSLRRAHILEAAIKVFAEKGFHAATVKDVATEAGVADGTIYNYFENKSALLMGLLDPRGDAVQMATDNMPPPPADLQNFLNEMLKQRLGSLTPQTLDIMRIVFSEALANAELRSIFAASTITPAVALGEPILQRFLAVGAMSPNDTQLTSRTIIAAVYGLVMLRLLGDEVTAQRFDEFPEHLSRIFYSGLKP
jgi:AcrR family transcriptional regulator